MTLICSAPQFPYQVYIAALAGHVPWEITQCLSTFMNLCYIFCQNAITSTTLSEAEALLDKFHDLHQFFVHAGPAPPCHYLTNMLSFTISPQYPCLVP
jgi:hypothetical protein